MRTGGCRSGIRPWAAVFLAAVACLPLRPAGGTVVDDPGLPLVAVFPIDVFDAVVAVSRRREVHPFGFTMKLRGTYKQSQICLNIR